MWTSTWIHRQTTGGAHHVPDPQDDGSCADMAAQTAACGVPAVPRGDHHLVTALSRLLEHVGRTQRWRVCVCTRVCVSTQGHPGVSVCPRGGMTAHDSAAPPDLSASYQCGAA